jgi:hypothetical protein
VTGVANGLRGEFTAALAGERIAFDTTLQTVALIEERCGGVPIVQVIEKAVFGRRAADMLALIAGALAAQGRADAETVAGRAASVEAEAFLLALMAALGFELARRPAGEGTALPLATAPGSGAAAAPSRSAP